MSNVVGPRSISCTRICDRRWTKGKKKLRGDDVMFSPLPQTVTPFGESCQNCKVIVTGDGREPYRAMAREDRMDKLTTSYL